MSSQSALGLLAGCEMAGSWDRIRVIISPNCSLWRIETLCPGIHMTSVLVLVAAPVIVLSSIIDADAGVVNPSDAYVLLSVAQDGGNPHMLMRSHTYLVFCICLSSLPWYHEVKGSRDYIVKSQMVLKKRCNDLPVFVGCLCPGSVKCQLSTLKCDCSVFVYICSIFRNLGWCLFMH